MKQKLALLLLAVMAGFPSSISAQLVIDLDLFKGFSKVYINPANGDVAETEDDSHSVGLFYKVNQDGKISLRGDVVDSEDQTYIMPAIDADFSGDLVLPTSINGHQIVSLSSNAFVNSMVKSVSIDADLDSISDCTFQNVTTLRSFSCKSVKTVSHSAFSGCWNLTNMPMITEEISNAAFYGCSSLPDSVRIYASVFTNNALNDCSGIKYLEIVNKLDRCYGNPIPKTIEELVFDNDVTEFSNSTFSGNLYLKRVKVKGTVGLVSDGCFKGCKNLESFDCDTIYNAKNEGFSGCIGLKNLPVIKGSIDYSAFYNCRSLPDTVVVYASEVKNGAFSGCTGIKHIRFANPVEISNAPMPYTLEKVTFEKDIASIKNGAFSNLNSLREVVALGDIKQISNEAFSRCSSLDRLPKASDKLSDNAFRSCNALPRVIELSTKEIRNGGISDNSSIRKIVLTDQVKSLYEPFINMENLGILDLRRAVNIEADDLASDEGLRNSNALSSLDTGTFVYLPEGMTSEDFNCINTIGGKRSCKETRFDGGKPYMIDEAFNTQGIKVMRDFTPGAKSTVYLPVALSATDVAALGKFYRFKEYRDGKVWFTPVSSTQANVAYLFEPASDTFIVNHDFVVSAAPEVSAVSGVGFIGTYESISWDSPQNIYGYSDTNDEGIAAGTFVKAAAGAKIKPYRAYFQLPEGVAAPAKLNIAFETATGIESIDAEEVSPSSSFNLAGQRVSNSYKGLIIRNGKKSVQK